MQIKFAEIGFSVENNDNQPSVILLRLNMRNLIHGVGISMLCVEICLWHKDAMQLSFYFVLLISGVRNNYRTKSLSIHPSFINTLALWLVTANFSESIVIPQF